MSTTPMVFADGTSGMVPQEKIAEATKDGGRVVQPMLFNDGTRGLVPLEHVHNAIQDGGTVIGANPSSPAQVTAPLGQSMQPDTSSAFTGNRFTITPQAGESFSETINRAAQAGKTVTPEEISSQGMKGLKESPAVLGAAAGIGASLPAMGAGMGELAAPTTQTVTKGSGFLALLCIAKEREQWRSL